ncbi:ORF80 [White spot syndrome virus]|uniref:Wsv516 n=3 Tax=White spot syndrome virus TaxID=342409 RepID=Q8VAB0_WSSVS|nr:wsv516 [Shrimp white spot syndrome virus]AFX59877.1 wsv516 [White spot syndrome virus]AAL33517.1 wsv516 [Shrimp white spot syndrome virus]AAL88909.1 WSSV041 [Shrimp white spot syndrome virus]ATU84044.1 ORF80 [White spot syndrome virus]AWQ61049.1 wsv516 [Shrimp white spot syndrome virus]
MNDYETMKMEEKKIMSLKRPSICWLILPKRLMKLPIPIPSHLDPMAGSGIGLLTLWNLLPMNLLPIL